MVTTELIRKVQNACPERREECEDEAAPGSATVEESPLLLEQWGRSTDTGLRMWREWERNQTHEQPSGNWVLKQRKRVWPPEGSPGEFL